MTARNAPCPCGSGRRYKECHGALGAGTAPPADGTRLLHEALALQQARRLDEAAARYRDALALLPDSADGLHMLGVIDMEQGRLDLAQERVTRALDLTGWRAPSMRHNLGLVLARRERPADAAYLRELRARYRGRCAVGGASTTAAPLVSVVIPAYGHAAYVERALRSVFAQTYRGLEVIVIDDGSLDGTADVAQRCLVDCPFPHALVRQANAGAAQAINRGIAQAAGAFVQLLNSDDMLAPERVASMLAATAASAARWAFSGIAVIDASDATVDTLADRRAFDLMCATHGVPLAETVGFALLTSNVAVSSGNLFFARDLAQEVGPFADYRYNHDWDFCLRALALAEPAWTGAALYRYRLHGSNTITESAQKARDEAMRVCGDYLGRASQVQAPSNPFAPALSTWRATFVNAVLGTGMGELVPPADLKRWMQQQADASAANEEA